MIRECFMMISKRSDRVCNFLEDVGAWSKDTKLVYRVYATLYFIFVVDGSESELGILDLIHVFVESLDHVFENVCELDLIFHTDKVNSYRETLECPLCNANRFLLKVHHILDEIVMGGMVLETNLQEILTAVKEQEELEAKGSKVASAKLKIKQQLR